MAWKVLHVRPRSEKRIAEYADIFKARYYLPLRVETKIYQRRKVVVEKPVFPGYFFASIDSDSEFRINVLDYIIHVIDPPSERKLLHELAQIRKALAVDPSLTTGKALSRGNRVVIESGPFAGIEGVVRDLKGRTRVRLNVEIVGQAVLLEVNASVLSVIK